MNNQARAVIVSGLINQFTATVTSSPRGCWRMPPMAEKSTASIIGTIIPQIRTAIGTLMRATSNEAIQLARSGKTPPRTTPTTIARPIHRER